MLFPLTQILTYVRASGAYICINGELSLEQSHYSKFCFSFSKNQKGSNAGNVFNAFSFCSAIFKESTETYLNWLLIKVCMLCCVYLMKTCIKIALKMCYHLISFISVALLVKTLFNFCQFWQISNAILKNKFINKQLYWTSK